MDPQTIRSCFMLTKQTHLELIRVIQAAIFSLHSLGISVSGVFSATGSCANLRRALLLFTAARLMWWPCEPCSDGLAWLSASDCGQSWVVIMSTRFSACRTHCIDVQQHAGRDFRTRTNVHVGLSLRSIPTVNSSVIHWCFWRFSGGGGSLVNMQPTRREDVEWCQVLLWVSGRMDQTSFFYPNFPFAMTSSVSNIKCLQHWSDRMSWGRMRACKNDKHIDVAYSVKHRYGYLGTQA